MKNKQLLKILVSVALLYIPSFGFSQAPYIYFLGGSGDQEYCSDAVPGGTFALELNNGRCGEWVSWTWVNITGNGCNGNNPKTVYISYPTSTTIYKCIVNGTYEYTFEITVTTTPTAFNVGGGSLCAYNADITLSNSQTGFTYEIYKNGVDQGQDITPTSPGLLTWASMPTGIYTIRGVNSYCSKWMTGHAHVDRTGCKGETKNEIDKSQSLIPEINVFPNPNTGNFYIENSIIGEYILLNEVGQEVQRIIFTSPNSVVEISNLRSGIYYIKNANVFNLSPLRILVVE